MEQTAVEWLFKLSKKRELDKFDLEQAKTMQKEQMADFAEFIASYSDKNKNIIGQMLHAKSKYDDAERTIDLLEDWLKIFIKK